MPVFTPQAIANTVAAVANELGSVVQNVVSQAGVSAAIVQQIEEGITGLQDAASALGQAEQGSQAQPIMQRVIADANAVLQAMSMLPLPAPASVVVRIVQVLVPTIAAAASIVWPAKSVAQPSAAEYNQLVQAMFAHQQQGGQEPQQGGQEPQQDRVQDQQPPQPQQPQQPPQQPQGQPAPDQPGQVPGTSPGTPTAQQQPASSNAPQARPGGSR